MTTPSPPSFSENGGRGQMIMMGAMKNHYENCDRIDRGVQSCSAAVAARTDEADETAEPEDVQEEMLFGNEFNRNFPAETEVVSELNIHKAGVNNDPHDQVHSSASNNHCFQ